MTIRTILAPSGVNQGSVDVLAATRLAEPLGAHLCTLVVGSVPPPPASDLIGQAYSTWAFAWQQENERVAARAKELADQLTARSEHTEVVPVYCLDGEVAGEVAARARYADLCLIGPETRRDPALCRRALDGILFDSPTPVLIHAENAQEFPPRTVVLAWNASLEASAALHRTLALVTPATEIRIAIVDPDATRHGVGEEPGADVATFLARHGARATVDVLSSGGHEAGAALLRHAGDVGAGMIVMGAYGHSRLRERIFGGTTRWMIENADIPVLMAR
jgi:nucleotide-binding universal stress UspA family protein